MTGMATAPNGGIPLGASKKGEDMSPEDWTGLVGGLVEFFAEEAAEPEHAQDSPRTMYVSRALTQPDAIALIKWARGQGFKRTLAPDAVHVTMAYSKTPIEWPRPLEGDAEAEPSGRAVELLGDAGAVVLRFESPDMERRWQQLRDAGASWDHDGFRPHVTFTLEAGDVDLAKVQPYEGSLTFGPERFKEIVAGEDWAAKAKAKMVGDAAPTAAGIQYTDPAGNVLLLKRSGHGDHEGEWAFPAGGIEAGETPEQAARRESVEETGHDPAGELKLLDRSASGQGAFHTFVNHVAEQFTPRLNHEHTEHAWAHPSNPPAPLHPGVANLFAAGNDGPKGEKADEQFRTDFGRDPTDEERERMASGAILRPRLGKDATEAEWWEHGERERDREEAAENDRQIVEALNLIGDPVARDAKRPAEHRMVVEYNGDFPMAKLLRHMHRLGAIGASRTITADDEDDQPVRFGWDGDGADKIISAEVDGADALADGAQDASPVTIDATHDGPWMSCMSTDGRRMYRNKNVPAQAEIAGKTVNVDQVLLAHEIPERADLEKIIQVFKEQSGGREPDAEERKVIYAGAHGRSGEPGERAHLKASGIDEDAWNAWCRGIEAKIEKGPFENEPDDADVKPIPHTHNDLGATDSAMTFAFDRDSVREFDRDGRMKVKKAHISRACVNPYIGHEIPGWEELGLDGEKIYKLLRDPEELKRAAPTFNGVQLLKAHKPVSIDDHQPYDIVGTTGSETEYNHPYLDTPLFVWTKKGLDLIESEEQRELSCGYHYRPDMTPGTYEGDAYDGVMRDIVGNHVALVGDGRAGPDVMVADGADAVRWRILETALTEAA